MINQNDLQRKFKRSKDIKFNPNPTIYLKMKKYPFSKKISADLISTARDKIDSAKISNPLITPRSDYYTNQYTSRKTSNQEPHLFTQGKFWPTSLKKSFSFADNKHISFEGGKNRDDFSVKMGATNTKFNFLSEENEILLKKMSYAQPSQNSFMNSNKISTLISYRDSIKNKDSSKQVQKCAIKNQRPKYQMPKDEQYLETDNKVIFENKDIPNHFHNTKFVQSKNYRLLSEAHLKYDFFRQDVKDLLENIEDDKSRKSSGQYKQQNDRCSNYSRDRYGTPLYSNMMKTVNLNKKNIQYGKTIYNNMTTKNLRCKNYKIKSKQQKQRLQDVSGDKSWSRPDDRSNFNDISNQKDNYNEQFNTTAQSRPENCTNLNGVLDQKPLAARTCANFFPKEKKAQGNILISDMENNNNQSSKHLNYKFRILPKENDDALVNEIAEEELLPNPENLQLLFPSGEKFSLKRLKEQYKIQRKDNELRACKQTMTEMMKEEEKESSRLKVDTFDPQVFNREQRTLSLEKLKHRNYERLNYENFFKSVWNL